MADTKENVQMQSFADPRGDGVNEGPSLKNGTAADQLDMQRLGKTQQTKVLLTVESYQEHLSDWTDHSATFAFSRSLASQWFVSQFL